MPAVAVAASWMESTKLPLREVKKRYTKSDMAIMAWRSSETAYNMKKSIMAPVSQAQRQNYTQPDRPEMRSAISNRDLELLEQRLGPVAIKLEEQGDGEFDLGKLTGDEALHFMNSLGIPFMPGMTREVK